MSDKEKLLVVLQLSEALELIHSKKLIHRDIKPSNIMINDSNEIKLIDFGVSKIATKTQTFTKGAIGTTRYMAPEFMDVDVDTDSDKPVRITPKVDIWSVGCLISELFSNQLPWSIVKNDFVLQKKLMEKKPFPIPDEITNEDVREIITKCVEIEPDKRLSAEQLSVLIKEKLKKFT